MGRAMVAQCLPAMWETWVQSLGQEDPLEKEMTVHSSILGGSVVKNPPAMWETWVQSLGWEDPLEGGILIHSRFSPGESPWAEVPGGLQSVVLQRVRYD